MPNDVPYTYDDKKYIVLQWVFCSEEDRKAFGYRTEMRVIKSTHPRFNIGDRFDFGFNHMVIKEGYSIIQLPHGPLPKEITE
jgi:hypothetical protein